MEKIIQEILKLGIWKPIDIYISNMLLKCISTYSSRKKMALQLVSACLTSNIGMGHTCLPISLINSGKFFQHDYSNIMNLILKKINISTVNEWQELLLSLPIISDGSYPSPLILDNKCLYLYRMWKDECTIAKFFCYKQKTYNSKKNKIINILNHLFLTNPSEINWNKIAVAISLTSQKIFISGGPGTGKTSNIAKIIAALLLFNSNNLQIRITTPTGKSSAILTNILQKTIKHIQLPNNYSTLKFPLQSTTLHNLLGSRLYNNTKNIYQNHINILNIDVLIIDEASMISSSILAKLISILPPNIIMILIGDHHQLYPIEPGSIFQDICELSNLYYYSLNRQKELTELTGYKLTNTSEKKIQHQYTNIVNNICILKKNYRFSQNSHIHQLATSINLGNSTYSLSLLNSRKYSDLHYLYLKKKKTILL